MVIEMDIYEQLPVLLRITLEGNEIKLRLDENGLSIFDSNKKPIQEIILSGCKLNQELVDSFQDLTTEAFEYEVFDRNGKTIFQFWGDYGRIVNEIECEKFIESFSEYTKADLVQKGIALHDLYVDLYKTCLHNSAIDTQLRDKLKFEVSNKIERSQRKVKFFEAKDKGKSEAFQSEIKFLEKIQRILTNDFEI